MSEMLDVYAAEAQARKYRDMAATEFLTSHGYKWEGYQWVAPDGLTPRQLAEQRAELLEALKWAMPLAVLGIEHGRMERIRCGHSDITGTYKSGETWVGIHQFEVDAIEKARAAIANATQQRNATGGEG